MRRYGIWIFIFTMGFLLTSCSPGKDGGIHITDAKTALGVNDKYMPVNSTKMFPKGTGKVFLWFSWKDAGKDVQVLARWHYVTDDMNILDYKFMIPAKEGTGSVALSMPEWKALPAGVYRVSLELDGRPLRSVIFKISEK